VTDSIVSWPGLGFDPAPGSAAAVAQLAQAMSAAQRQLTEALQIISGVGRGGTWTGDAASAFLSRVGELPKHLQQAEDSFGAAAHELTGWQSQLASMQQKAQELESEAVNARARLNGAEMNPVLGLRGHVFANPQDAQEAQQRYDAAVQEINTAQNDLAAIVDQANRLLAEHRGLAEEAAKAIDSAAHLAPDSPGLFASLLGDLESVIQGNIKLAEDAMNWVKAHANAISAVGDMLATASTVVAAAAVAVTAFTGGGGAEVAAGLDLVSAGLSAGALGAHSIAKAAGAPVTDRTLMEDGIGAVTLGLGGDAKVLTRGAKLSESTAKVVELMEKGEPLGHALTASGMANSAVDLAGDPSSLGYFVPKNGRQAVEAGTVPGGELLVGFENAWKAGSAKDRAAHAGA
jgi:ElaB/YqjD/DUF883 family membrane-anchored ribosome-binding protein